MSNDILTTLVHVRVWNKETTLPDVYDKLCNMEQELRGNTLIHAPFFIYILRTCRNRFSTSPRRLLPVRNLPLSKHSECPHGTCPYKLTCLLHRPAKQKWIETCQGYIIWLHPKIKSKSSCHLFSLGWTRICKTYDSSIQHIFYATNENRCQENAKSNKK